RLGSKIGLVITVQIVIMLALVWINFWQMHALHEKMEQTYSVTIPKGGTTLRLRALMLDVICLEKDAVLSDDDKESQNFAALASKLLDQIDSLKKELAEQIEHNGIDKEREHLAKLQQQWQGFRAIHKEIMDLAVQNTNFKANRLLEGEILEKLLVIRDAL